MAGFSHFLPNELFTDSAEGHLHSIYTWAMLPARACSFMKLFPEFYIFSSFTLWKQWGAPPQRGMEIQSPYICSSVITKQWVEWIFARMPIIQSVKNGPRRKSLVTGRRGSVSCAVYLGVLLPFPDSESPLPAPWFLLPDCLLQAPALWPSELQEKLEEMVTLKLRIPLYYFEKSSRWQVGYYF